MILLGLLQRGVRDKEKSESPTGIEPMLSRTPSGRSIHWALKTIGEGDDLSEFMYDTSRAYC